MASRFRPNRIFRNESGAFDLPSVLIGVAVVAILAVGVMALIFGAIPWAQNRAAAQDLAALTTAQGAAKAKDGGYVDPTRMSQLGYLSDDAALEYSVAADESCWVGVTKAKSGKHLYTIDGSAPAELTRDTKTSCLQGDLEYSKISAGFYGACGIASEELYCWGWNSSGHVGDGTTTDRHQPVKVGGDLAGKRIIDVSASASHRCAIDEEHLLYCWGFNENGEAGTSVKGQRRTPGAVQGVLAGEKVTSVSVGDAATCAVSEKKLYCWGSGFGYAARTLGDAAGSTKSAVPVRIDSGALSGADIASVSVGTYHACALTEAGRASCWGHGSYGQIGGGATSTENPLPVAVDMSKVTGGSLSNIAVSEGSTCAAGGGKAYCWGLGSAGQTGNGAVRTQTVPTQIGGAAAGRTLTRVSMQGDQGCAADEHDEWLCWGANSSGTLGTGDTSPVLYPVVVAGGPAEQLSVGYNMICALDDGTVHCVGNNKYGGLGNGTTADAFTPVRVLEPAGRPASWVDSVLDGGRLP